MLTIETLNSGKSLEVVRLDRGLIFPSNVPDLIRYQVQLVCATSDLTTIHLDSPEEAGKRVDICTISGQPVFSINDVIGETRLVLRRGNILFLSKMATYHDEEPTGLRFTFE